MVFHTSLPVRFGDVDLARIMYFPHIINYIHIAMEEFIEEACGISYFTLMSEQGLAFPHVNLNSTFKQGLPYGTHIQVEVVVLNIGNTSLQLRFRFYKDVIAPEQLAVESIDSLVCVRLNDWKKLRLPDELREKLTAYLVTESSVEN